MIFRRPAIPLLHPAAFLATWGGVGLIKSAPGTWGSLAALPFAWLIQSYLGNIALLIAAVIIFLIGWLVSSFYMNKGNVEHDPSEIVIDEVAGQWWLLSMLPFSMKAYVVGLLLFRFFDIVKPWPISFVDKKIGGGFGVMLDDIMAACYPVVLLVIASAVSRLSGNALDIYRLWQMLE